ncbi:uncharacterized protein [Amphiura filiformis]|uniref:uncharacterized protein n=1 Tax=Amphiura filiformis TaxID=82378 RepID=UPI003B210D99
MDKLSNDDRFRSNSSKNSSQQSQTPTYGGTKFCIVAVPSPKMQRPKQTHVDEPDGIITLQRDVKQPDGMADDTNRISNPAFRSSRDTAADNNRVKHANGNHDSSRIGRMLQTLRRDLKSLQQQDQVLLRQFLNIYQTISDLHYKPQQTFQFHGHDGSDPLSPAIMADEVRDLVSYQGNLNIRDVVSRLSPIKRQRTTSEPFLDDDSLSLDNSTEDLLSLSSPFI